MSNDTTPSTAPGEEGYYVLRLDLCVSADDANAVADLLDRLGYDASIVDDLRPR